MFSTFIFPVILLSLTSCSFASMNCSKTYTVNKENYQDYNIPESKKVVCFKAQSGRVRLRFSFAMCDWHDFRDKAYDDKYYDSLKVYDGCNTTENEVVGKKVHCSKCCKYQPFCNRVMRWTSERNSCLKVVFQRNSRGRHGRSPSLQYGMANVKDGKDNFTEHRQWYPCRDEHRPDPDPPRPRPAPPPAPAPVLPPPTPSPVTLIFNELRGTIKSPNYPGRYPPNLTYTYIIELPEKNKRIQLMFRFVDLPRRENGDCKRDYIEIYDGIASWTRVKEICGNESIYQPIISKSYKMRVKFTADKVNGKNRGFEAMYDPLYQPPIAREIHVLGVVVIGTACGLMFFIVTFLAICNSRRLAVCYED